jgi:hypothetical protein
MRIQRASCAARVLLPSKRAKELQRDAILSLNMVHVAPWQAALGLLAGGKRLLRPDGILFLYGPFIVFRGFTELNLRSNARGA